MTIKEPFYYMMRTDKKRLLTTGSTWSRIAEMLLKGYIIYHPFVDPDIESHMNWVHHSLSSRVGEEMYIFRVSSITNKTQVLLYVQEAYRSNPTVSHLNMYHNDTYFIKMQAIPNNNLVATRFLAVREEDCQ